MDVRKVSREVALKFLLGRKFDVERAHTLLNNYQRTIQVNHFETVIVSDVVDALKTAEMYIPGTRDRNGAALFIIDAGKHIPGAFSPDDIIRLAFFMGEKIISSPRTQSTGITIIVDMTEFGWKNFDLALQKSVLNLFTENIPARVKNILLYRAPWWISTLVRMVSPFLKQKMRDRLQVVEEGTLQRWVEGAELPVELGGNFKYNHDAFIQAEIEKMGEGAFRSQRHLDAEGREIFAIPIKAPAGSVQMVDPIIEAELQAERQKTIKKLDEYMTEMKRNHTVGDPERLPLGPDDIRRALGSRSERLTMDLGDLPKAQPNLEARRRSFSSRSSVVSFEAMDEIDDPVAIKKMFKDGIQAGINKRLALARGESLPEEPAEFEEPVQIMSKEEGEKTIPAEVKVELTELPMEKVKVREEPKAMEQIDREQMKNEPVVAVVEMKEEPVVPVEEINAKIIPPTAMSSPDFEKHLIVQTTPSLVQTSPNLSGATHDGDQAEASLSRPRQRRPRKAATAMEAMVFEGGLPPLAEGGAMKGIGEVRTEKVASPVPVSVSEKDVVPPLFDADTCDPLQAEPSSTTDETSTLGPRARKKKRDGPAAKNNPNRTFMVTSTTLSNMSEK